MATGQGVSYESVFPFEFYARRLGSDALGGVRLVHGAERLRDTAAMRADAQALPGGARVWSVFAFPSPDCVTLERAALEVLSARGVLLETIDAARARAHLHALPR